MTMTILERKNWENRCVEWENLGAKEIKKEFVENLSEIVNYMIYLWTHNKIEIAKNSKLPREYFDIHDAMKFYNESKDDYRNCWTRTILYHQQITLNQASSSSSIENPTLLT